MIIGAPHNYEAILLPFPLYLLGAKYTARRTIKRVYDRNSKSSWNTSYIVQQLKTQNKSGLIWRAVQTSNTWREAGMCPCMWLVIVFVIIVVILFWIT
jgi:hypothetical protein